MNRHIPVMLSEVIEYLGVKKDGLYIDATVGEGGYSEAIAKKIGKAGKILAIDATAKSIEIAKSNLAKYQEKIIFVQDNFKNIDQVAQKVGFTKINGIVYDLGLASWQLEQSHGGIGFKKNEQLDMRIFEDSKYTAADVLGKFSVKEIANILYKYADISKSWAIARKIENFRKNNQINTTGDLLKALGTENPKFLAPIFQALRIYVNNEIKNLELSLGKAVNLLADNGKMVVVSFHSGEDRIVKNIFKQIVKENKKYKILTKKPITATQDEVKINPKSRSAKLRALKHLA